MAEIIIRKKKSNGRKTAVEIIVHGDDFARCAHDEVEQLKANGHEPTLFIGNGAAQISYVEIRASKRLLWPYMGEMLSITEIAQRTGIPYATLYQRLNFHNFESGEAFSKPVLSRKENRARFMRLVHALEAEIRSE